MTAPANPFLIGRYLDDRYFCDREIETTLLKKHIINGRNVTLSSPRRMGKTGLIHHFFESQHIKSDYLTVFVDIYATSCLSEFVYLLSHAVYAAVRGSFRSQLEHFFKSISSLRIGLKIDAVTGEPTLDLKVGQIKTPDETLKQVFGYLDAQSKPVIVAIDEFQQVSEYPEKNTEALLRTLIQQSTNIQFVFAGSKKHLIGNMFNTPSKPFYQSTLFMDLRPIPSEVYCEFAQRLFDDYSRTLQADVVKEVYRLTHGVTWYTQVLLNELFAETPQGETCTVDRVPIALEQIIDANSYNYLDMLSRLPERQKALLLAIARAVRVTEITSAEFVESYGLHSASSVQSALRTLQKYNLVTSDQGAWRVNDIFFGTWLARY